MQLNTRIIEKPWGRTDIAAAFGPTPGERIGEIWYEDPAGADAPLMVKYLFTSERLSIQVHPDDEQARATGFARGKDECWLVLDAEPGATIGIGLNRACTREALRAAAIDGSIEELIAWVPAHVGDFIYNPAGTIHALGAGLTVLEVQQNVDCTYRLYDYGRPRALHLDAGLAVARMTPDTDPRNRTVPPTGTITLVSGPHFHLIRAHGPLPPKDESIDWPSVGPLTVIPLSGDCTVDGATLHFGQCASAADPAAIVLAPDAMALIGWPA